MKKIIHIILIVSVTAAHAQTDYLPISKDTDQILHYSEFSLGYSEANEQAIWVSYTITKKEVITKRERCNCFVSDLNIISGSAALSDYKGSGYDRGHLSPSAANKISALANRESFLMSNMSPQLPAFNRYIWKNLESKVRDFAYQNEKVHVVTGPIFKNNLGTIGTNEVTIPGHYYKVVLSNNNGSPKAIAFLMKHEGSKAPLNSFVVTVDEIENLTGIDFFTELDDELEETIEKSSNVSDWNF